MLQSCRGQQVGAGIRCQMTRILKGEGLQRTQNPSLGGGTVLDALTSPFFFFFFARGESTTLERAGCEERPSQGVISKRLDW